MLVSFFWGKTAAAKKNPAKLLKLGAAVEKTAWHQVYSLFPFCGYSTLESLSTVIWSIVSAIWGDQCWAEPLFTFESPPPPHPHGPDGGPSPAGTLKEHSLWSSVVYKCRRGITLSVCKKKSNSGNSFRKWFTFLLRQVSDVQRQWKLYNLVSLRKLEKKRFSNEHLNCHAN